MTLLDLKTAFAIAQSQLAVYVDGITAEMASGQPRGGDGHVIGNPVNWVLGHILSERVEALEIVSAVIAGKSCQTAVGNARVAVPLGMPDLSQYVTGSTPDVQTFLPFDELLALIPVTFEAINKALRSVDEDDLAAKHDSTLLGQTPTLAQVLNTYTLHEMYHVGQISVARKAYGLQTIDIQITDNLIREEL